MAGSTTATEPVANRRIGIPLVLMAGIFWSLSGLVYRWIEVATAWQVLFYRSLSLFCFIALWLVLRYRGRLVGVFQSAGRLSVLGGLCLSIAFSGYILALDQTTVANALFILAAAPFFAALLCPLPARWSNGYVHSAALGLAVMAGKELAIGRGLGELFALASALGLAGLTIILALCPTTRTQMISPLLLCMRSFLSIFLQYSLTPGLM